MKPPVSVWAGFRPAKVSIKASVHGGGVLTVLQMLSSYSAPLEGLIVTVKEQGHLPLIATAWYACYFSYELLRRRLLFDIQDARYQNWLDRRRNGRR